MMSDVPTNVHIMYGTDVQTNVQVSPGKAASIPSAVLFRFESPGVADLKAIA